MEELMKRINIASEAIEGLCTLLISGAAVSAEELLSVSTPTILSVFPDIVECYQRTEFKNAEENIEYWSAQLDRVLQALEGNDRFFLIDVLYHETKENMLLFQQEVMEMGLVAEYEVTA